MPGSPSPRPPRFAAWLLNRLLPDGPAETPVGDFEEFFHHLAVTEGSIRATCWYWGQVLGMIPHRIHNAFYWYCVMFENYLKTAFRNLVRYRTYAAINLAGLTLGIACFLVIYLYVQDQRSYDRFHENVDRLYRVVVDWEQPTGTFQNALTSAPMGPQIQADFPDVEAMARFLPYGSEVLMQHGTQRFFEGGGYFAGAAVFEMFTFNLYEGDPETALEAPNTVVLTTSLARKYFGDGEALGQTIRLNNSDDYTVTGVMDDLPRQAHMHFDFLLSFSTLQYGWLAQWGSNPFYTYVLLAPGHDVAQMEAAFPQMITTHAGPVLERMGMSWRMWLQPLTEIHVRPLGNEPGTPTSIEQLYLLGVVALFILLLACINFVNLATARATTRAKEVGMRKVLGANRRQLAAQFFGESTLLTVIAVVLGVGLVAVVLPAGSALLGSPLALQWDATLVFGLLGVTVLVSVLAGAYPALMLSGLAPLRVLKGWLGRGGPTKTRSRRGLVIVQFSISVLLIIATATVYQQLHFMQTKHLGLQPDQVVAMPVYAALQTQGTALAEQMTRLGGVEQVAFASRKPGTGTYGVGIQRADQGEEAPLYSFKYMAVDYNYFDVLQIDVRAGHTFDAAIETDTEGAVVLNEQAARELGWATPEEALGQRIVARETSREIIGVVENFHFQPLHTRMQPLVLVPDTDGSNFLLAKVQATDLRTTLADMEATWNQLAPAWPFSFSFLDRDYATLYENEERFGQLFATFALLALFIACLGLFGLATFAVERRTKEMGIRKVLGASSSGIVVLLSKDFARLVLLANVIAWPVAYIALDRWLDTYAFRTDLAWWVFGVAGLIVLAIAWATISTQALRASRTNPIESLRYE